MKKYVIDLKKSLPVLKGNKRIHISHATGFFLISFTFFRSFFNRILSVRKKQVHVPYTITFYLLSFTFFLMFSCTSPTTSPDKVTFSGTVTLEGAGDNSGVTVSLYKTVELDTAITNERDAHSSVGLPLSQQSEFFWRTADANYTTTIKSDGSWEIKADAGNYNIIVEKDGFGWYGSYDQSKNTNSNITLPKPVILKGSYFEPLTIPANSFVVIDGRVTFNFAELKIGAGSIVEFRNNGKLDINGPLHLNGTSGGPIFLTIQDTSKTAEVFVHEASNCTIEHTMAHYLKNGFYLKNTENVTFNNNRMAFTKTAVEIFGCANVAFANNVISGATLGLNLSSSGATVQQNIFFNIKTNGLEYFDNPGSVVTKNVFKQCQNGFAINFGGFRTSDSQLNLNYNDFVQNENHIFMGYKVRGGAHSNNFYKSTMYAVKCNQRFIADTLDFKDNYWMTNSTAAISQKILDASDFDTGTTIYPFIDFVPVSSTKINW